MDPYAATATATAQTSPWAVLAAVVAAATLIYVISCTWWPFARCWCCKGDGRHSRKDGKVFRPCRLCRGGGRRLRIGRRLFNMIRRRQREGTR